jgi:hypothetical protein
VAPTGPAGRSRAAARATAQRPRCSSIRAASTSGCSSAGVCPQPSSQRSVGAGDRGPDPLGVLTRDDRVAVAPHHQRRRSDRAQPREHRRHRLAVQQLHEHRVGRLATAGAGEAVPVEVDVGLVEHVLAREGAGEVAAQLVAAVEVLEQVGPEASGTLGEATLDRHGHAEDGRVDEHEPTHALAARRRRGRPRWRRPRSGRRGRPGRRRCVSSSSSSSGGLPARAVVGAEDRRRAVAVAAAGEVRGEDAAIARDQLGDQAGEGCGW